MCNNSYLDTQLISQTIGRLEYAIKTGRLYKIQDLDMCVVADD